MARPGWARRGRAGRGVVGQGKALDVTEVDET
jgi:hypothetical protein